MTPTRLDRSYAHVAVLATLAWAGWAGLALAQTVPFLPRTGTNLVSNPTINGTTSWSLSSGAVYDASASRTADGSGAIKLPQGTQARIDSIQFTVQTGHTYTIAAYIKTAAWPAGNADIYMFYNGSTYSNQATGYGGNTQTGLYEEIVGTFVPDGTSTSVSVAIVRGLDGDTGTGDMWVDEIYVGENLGFGSPPAAKTPFNGQYIHVDALGNMQVWRNSTVGFQPFFPFCIYRDYSVSGWRPNMHQFYSNQGFSCDVWNYSGGVAVAAQATSSFNPYGIMSGIQIAQYMWPDQSQWDVNGVNLTNEITAAQGSGFPEHVLWYYWDNENHINEWNNPMSMLAHAETADAGGGARKAPIYVLQGSFNVTRFYETAAGHTPTNMTGTYTDAGSQTGGAGHGAAGILIQQRLQNQTIPVIIYQANIVHASEPAGGLRTTLYRGLMVGAKGIGLWKDCYANDCSGLAIPVENTLWWPDVPNLRTELDAMMPLIAQPHWTSWGVTFNSTLPIEVGTRDYGGNPHMIILNTSTSPVTVTFTLNGLASSPTTAKNFFTGSTITSVSANQFTMTIPANGINSGTAVVRLEGGGPPAPTATLTASALTISLGGSLTLTWSSTNAASCTGTNFSTGAGSPTMGSVSVSPSANITYTVGCTDGTTTATDAKTITVIPPCATPAVHWRMNEGTGSTTADTGSAGATGTLMNGPTWVAGVKTPYALTFNGTNQYVSNAAFSLPAGSPFTFEVWLKPTGGHINGAFTVGGTTANLFGCYIPWDDNHAYCDFNGAPGIDFLYTPYIGIWTHVAYKGNATRRDFYVNGVLVNTDATAATPLPTMTRLDLGRSTTTPSPDQFMMGPMDDFSLYTCLRSDADIATDAQARLPQGTLHQFMRPRARK